MPKTPLTAVCLAQLGDGYVGRQIDQAMKIIHDDIVERGDDGKTRKLVITVCYEPEPKTGNADITVDIVPKMPPLRSPKTTAKYEAAAGGFIFNPDCRENPSQMTFADIRATDNG